MNTLLSLLSVAILIAASADGVPPAEENQFSALQPYLPFGFTFGADGRVPEGILGPGGWTEQTQRHEAWGHSVYHRQHRVPGKDGAGPVEVGQSTVRVEYGAEGAVSIASATSDDKGLRPAMSSVVSGGRLRHVTLCRPGSGVCATANPSVCRHLAHQLDAKDREDLMAKASSCSAAVRTGGMANALGEDGVLATKRNIANILALWSGDGVRARQLVGFGVGGMVDAIGESLAITAELCTRLPLDYPFPEPLGVPHARPGAPAHSGMTPR